MSLIRANMKSVIIRNIFAVGMHHWGPREMSIGVIHYCKWEEDNPKDQCAIAIFANKELTRRVAYIRREDSSKLFKIFRDGFVKDNICYVKAKQPAGSRFSRRTGPMQNISLAFRCNDENVTSRMPKSYTDEAMSAAITDVKNNQLSIRESSKKYNVPKSSLSDRLTGKVQAGSKWGRRPLFSDQDEKEMIKCATDRAQWGIGFSKSNFIRFAGAMADSKGIKMKRGRLKQQDQIDMMQCPVSE
ncbi:hypothetical protein KUTeg_000175 [Tegillarca granosa]|uniref:HTH psq-type domain-containing protein n=1 Tax=Tegillarca granosa TaxID=220873 RepID=A0ABQ9FWX5_TEGGR|nr:hypothetical protein KUTeg_000175 [Tegillarca granosa]